MRIWIKLQGLIFVDNETLTLHRECKEEQHKHQGSTNVPRIHVGLRIILSDQPRTIVALGVQWHTYIYTQTHT